MTGKGLFQGRQDLILRSVTNVGAELLPFAMHISQTFQTHRIVLTRISPMGIAILIRTGGSQDQRGFV